MHALSVKQPYAERIASGEKRAEFRTWQRPIVVGRDLLIVASRTIAPGYAGEPCGVAICVVHVDAIVPDARHGFAWRLSNPRRVAPVAMRGFASLFRANDEAIRYVTSTAQPREARKLARRTTARDDRASADPHGLRAIERAGAAIVAEAVRASARERAGNAAVDVDVDAAPDDAPAPARAPYAILLGKRTIGYARTPAAARTAAAKLATKHGAIVSVERDGFHLYDAGPL